MFLPILQLGPLTLPAHPLFEMLAFLLGFRFYLYCKKQVVDPIAENKRWAILLGAMLGALLGSRLLALLEHQAAIHGLADIAAHLIGSKTIVGGLLGGLIGVETAKKIIGETQSSGDLFTYPLILAMTIGRFGCFLSGIDDATHGLPSQVPWAMDLGDGIPRHPTALYEILFLPTLAVALFFLERRFSLATGARFKLFLATYLAWRLAVDALKPSPPLWLTLSAIQLASLAGLGYYVTLFLRKGICNKAAR